MPTIILIGCIVFIILGVTYVVCVTKIDKVENKYRNESSTIDTFLWDIQHRLKKSGDIVEKYGIDPATIRDAESLGLGMPASMQMKKLSDYMEHYQNLKLVDRSIITDEADREEVIKYIKEIEQLRRELIAETVAYNKSVNEYNGVISRFPYSFVAQRKRKSTKSTFYYAFVPMEDEKI
ncbi:MAG: hypothetical protein K6C35_03365 [Eubacterium sp.]|nr:hypothetical protein [Eubacterium sp.]SEF93006.1 transport complex B protein 46 C terminal [Eubacterium ruminantium]